MCKRIFKFELQLGSYWQNIKFSRYCPKFHIFTKIVIFKYICSFLDQLLHPYKFYGRDMLGILFFSFCQLWAVNLAEYFFIHEHNRSFFVFLHNCAYACTLNVCKRHVAIDTGVKQIKILCLNNNNKMLFQWDKIVTVFKCIWEGNVCKFIPHKTFTRTKIPVLSVISVLQNYNTVTNVDQIRRWIHIFLIDNTHTEVAVPPVLSSKSCSSGFVWNQLHC